MPAPPPLEEWTHRELLAEVVRQRQQIQGLARTNQDLRRRRRLPWLHPGTFVLLVSFLGAVLWWGHRPPTDWNTWGLGVLCGMVVVGAGVRLWVL